MYQPCSTNFQHNQDLRREGFRYLHPLIPQMKGLMHFLHQDMHNILPTKSTEIIKLTGDKTTFSPIKTRVKNTVHVSNVN